MRTRKRPTLTMLHISVPAMLLLSELAFSALPGGMPALAAQTLPPTPPTSLTSPNSLPAPIAGSPTGGSSLRHHKARVLYANGLLDVRADNSSLNQVLRDISRETGMTIVGGVADQRIFGNYGPATPTTVLQTLLDGTGVNVLLKETANGAPGELILTPRTGGASPPSPNSASYDATESEPELGAAGSAQPGGAAPAAAANAVSKSLTAPVAPAKPVAPPPPANNVYGSPANVSPTAATLPTVQSVPTESLTAPSTAQPPPTGIVNAPNPPPSYSTTSGYTSQTPPQNEPNNPLDNGSASPPSGQSKTPQQIYEELKALQQQKQSSQPQSGQPQTQQEEMLEKMKALQQQQQSGQPQNSQPQNSNPQ